MSEHFRIVLQDGEQDDLIYGDYGGSMSEAEMDYGMTRGEVQERWHRNWGERINKATQASGDKQSPTEPDQTAKQDAGKPRLFLVPPEAVKAIGHIMTFGCRKYGEGSWRGVEIWRYRDAMCRHLEAYKTDPQGVDAESGMPHLWHLLTNAAFLTALEWDRQ